jgi:hypothetical protein
VSLTTPSVELEGDFGGTIIYYVTTTYGRYLTGPERGEGRRQSQGCDRGEKT